MKSVLLEEMSWFQVKNAMEAGYKTVIIALGSIEQHGPHLPEGTDSMLGYTMGEALAKELGNALVAPTIRPGLSEHHMAFPGSLTLRMSTFVALMEDYVDCYIRHGFENIILLPTHGGNFKAVEDFANAAPKNYPGTKILCCLNHEIMTKLSEEVSKEENIPVNILGSHSGFAETSSMLAFYPQLVDMSLAEEGFVGDFAQVRDKMFAEGMYGITKNGIIGDARNANAELGVKSRERFVKTCAEIIRKQLT